jgi:copper chaperone for superoxide dismutase
MSNNFTRVGDVLSLPEKENVGLLGALQVEGKTGKLNATIPVNVEMLYGRSACLHHKGSIVTAAMVVRSSGVYQNTKRICACDGTTIWEAQSSI